MKNFNVKRFLLNCLIVLIICFSFLFFISIYGRSSIIWSLNIAFIHSIRQAIIFVPILFIFEMTKMKNSFKIIFALVLTIVVSVIFFLNNFELVF